MVHRRSKISLVGAAALGVLALTVAPATAQSGTGTAAAKTADVKINEIAQCSFTANAPGYYTKGKINASGKIDACGPVPDKCRLQTAIMLGPISTVEHKDSGWGGCKGNQKLVHKCTGIMRSQIYYTEVVLQIEWRGQHASKIIHSKKVKLFCS